MIKPTIKTIALGQPQYNPVTGIPQNISALTPLAPVSRYNGPALNNYSPDWRDRARWWLGDKLGGSYNSRKFATNLIGTQNKTGLLDFTPAGMAFGANDGYRTWDEGARTGNFWKAMAGTLQFGLNVIPIGMGVGGVGKAIIKSDAVRNEAGRFVADEVGSIPLWHGSSNKFDKFKLNSSGGIGAQAYGQGSYLSDAQKVAKAYAKQTSQMQNSNMLNAADGDLSKAVEFAKNRVKSYRELVAKKKASGSSDYQLAVEKLDAAKFRLKRMEEIKAGTLSPNGYVYQANVVSDPSTFFDYGKNLSDQSWQIRAAFGKYGRPAEWKNGTMVGSGRLVVRKNAIDPSKNDYFLVFNNGVRSKISEQELTDIIGNPNTGQISAGAAFKRIVEEKGDKGAVTFLKKRGISGSRIEDNMGRGSNYVVYEPNTISVIKRNGKLLPNRLMIHHNLTPNGVVASDRLGGIPMPSIAVSNVDHPLTNFGEITLVGDPNNFLPSKTNSVFRGDAFTGRQPRDTLRIKDEYRMAKAFSNDPVFGRIKGSSNIPLYYGSSLSNVEEKVKMVQLAVSNGLDPKVFDGKDISEAYLKSVAFIRKNKLSSDLSGQPGLSAFGKIEYGYDLGLTPSGNRRKMIPATAENAFKIMKKNKAFLPATEAGFHVSPAKFSAANMSKMKNISEMKAFRDQVQSRSNTSEIFNKFENKFRGIEWRVHEYAPKGSDFAMASQYMLDLSTGKNVSVFGDWVNTVPESLKSEIRQLGAESRSLPTNYMEMKPKKVVGLGDFSAALIPEGTTPEVVKILKDNGIQNILEYPQDKRAQFMRKLPELMFGVGGGLTFYQMGVKNVAKALGLPTDHFSQEDADTYRNLKPRQKIKFWQNYKGA